MIAKDRGIPVKLDQEWYEHILDQVEVVEGL